jgi:hypothetical protein
MIKRIDPERAKALKAEKNREQYERFLETAKSVEASDDPKDFDRAFKKVTAKRPS